MTNLITLPRMAQVLGAADNIDADGTAALHNRLRNLARKGFLIPIDDPNATATSARLYEPREIARARMLSDAVLGGLEGDGLKAVGEALKSAVKHGGQHPESAKVNGGFSYDDGLSSAIRGIAAGERWLLRVRGRIQPDGTPSWVAWVTWGQPKQHDSEKARDTLNRQAPTFFEANLDFRVRLSPLLELLTD